MFVSNSQKWKNYHWHSCRLVRESKWLRDEGILELNLSHWVSNSWIPFYSTHSNHLAILFLNIFKSWRIQHFMKAAMLKLIWVLKTHPCTEVNFHALKLSHINCAWLNSLEPPRTSLVCLPPDNLSDIWRQLSCPPPSPKSSLFWNKLLWFLWLFIM